MQQWNNMQKCKTVALMSCNISLGPFNWRTKKSLQRNIKSSPFCSLVWGWARYLVSHLEYKFINVWGQALSWGNPQDWVKVFISKTTPMWCFVEFHQRKQLFTQVCAAKHRQRASNLGAQLWHCVGDETSKLSSAHGLIFCLQCVITLELNQLHLEICWCALHVNCKRIAEQLKFAFLGFKVGKFCAFCQQTVHSGTWQ